MKFRRPRPGRALALSIAALTAVPTIAGTIGAADAAPRPQATPAHTFTPLSSISSDRGDGFSGAPSGVFTSPDGNRLYGLTFLASLELSMASLSYTGTIGLTSGANASAPSVDGATRWVVTGDGSFFYLEPITLNTGVVGTRITIGAAAVYGTTGLLHSPTSVAVGSVGGVNMAYVYFAGRNYYNANAEIIVVNLDTGSVTTTIPLGVHGFPPESYYNVALAADGSEMYVSHGTEVLAFDTSNLLNSPAKFSLNATMIKVWDDEPLNSSNKGILYATSPDTLTTYDLDTDTTARTVTIGLNQPYQTYKMFILPDGTAVIGQGEAHLVWVEPDDTVLPIDFSSALQDPSGSPGLFDLFVHEDPTYGTCIFTANNGGSYSAIAVDQADCGAFNPRLGDLADMAIDGSSTITIDAPSEGDRASSWSAIAVYSGCELVKVIEPTFPASLTINWSEVASSNKFQVRAYNAANLTDGSITDLNTLTCDTPFREERVANVAYAAFRANRVGAGSDNSCAAVSADTYCWGANFVGQLGDGSVVNTGLPSKTAAPTSTPTPPPEPLSPSQPVTPFATGTVSHLDSGDLHSCAVVASRAYCWGMGDDGKLGNGTETDSTTPVLVAANDGFTNTAVTDLAVGEDHTCAIEAGVLYCWGYNTDRQIGTGDRDDRLLPTKVVSNGDFTNSGVTSVGAGFSHTCAVQRGAVFCWGYNDEGYLGDGTENFTAVPVKVVDNPSEGFTNDNVTQVVASDRGTCAIRSGVVFCWGYDNYGKNGTNKAGDTAVPMRMVNNEGEGFTNTGVSFLTAGEQHYCLLQSEVAFCWGNGGQGRIGNNDDESDNPKAVKVVDVADGFTNANVTDIDAGFRHTCAIASGRAYCWGENYNGMLGNAETARSFVPVAVCCGGDEEDIEVTFSGGSGRVVFNGGLVSCTSSCTESFRRGTRVTMTVVPAPGYTFLGWSGKCTGRGPCAVTLEEAVQLRASFIAGSLPPTGGSPRAVWFGLALLALGFGAQHLVRRRRPVA